MGIFGIKRSRDADWEPSYKKEVRKEGDKTVVEYKPGLRRVGRLNEPVKKLRRKKALKELKQRKKEEKTEQKIRELGRRTKKKKAETSYYQAKAEKKRAKRKASFQWKPIPTPEVRIRKKKQGKKLSRKKRITLI